MVWSLPTHSRPFSHDPSTAHHPWYLVVSGMDASWPMRASRLDNICRQGASGCAGTANASCCHRLAATLASSTRSRLAKVPGAGATASDGHAWQGQLADQRKKTTYMFLCNTRSGCVVVEKGGPIIGSDLAAANSKLNEEGVQKTDALFFKPVRFFLRLFTAWRGEGGVALE